MTHGPEVPLVDSQESRDVQTFRGGDDGGIGETEVDVGEGFEEEGSRASATGRWWRSSES